MGDTYNPDREINDSFLAKVMEWIEATGEVFVALRYLRMAGARDYALCRSQEEFLSLIEIVPIGTDIIVFQDKQLPLRGIASSAFDEAVLNEIPDGTEFLLAGLEPLRSGDPRLSIDTDETHTEMRSSLAEAAGRSIAVGTMPPFHLRDNDRMISASKGGIDGPR
jgi:hypothetical protein